MTFQTSRHRTLLKTEKTNLCVPVNVGKSWAKILSGAVAVSLMLPSIRYVRLDCHLALGCDAKAGVEHEEVGLI